MFRRAISVAFDFADDSSSTQSRACQIRVASPHPGDFMAAAFLGGESSTALAVHAVAALAYGAESIPREQDRDPATVM
jgi:hypothetical protein